MNGENAYLVLFAILFLVGLVCFAIDDFTLLAIIIIPLIVWFGVKYPKKRSR